MLVAISPERAEDTPTLTYSLADQIQSNPSAEQSAVCATVVLYLQLQA